MIDLIRAIVFTLVALLLSLAVASTWVGLEARKSCAERGGVAVRGGGWVAGDVTRLRSEAAMPLVGERYVYLGYADPWCRFPRDTVLEVRSGYVLLADQSGHSRPIKLEHFVGPYAQWARDTADCHGGGRK